ncbi:hypothetical protein [Microbacterium hydrocarbonoxydans]|uniref:ABC transporter n=1 Tax=Microbacterium hydrocarbonoxydans TaxID=273678 RepID=A0A1H4RF72_9MICO|nr:hypothetical protein [Microbacterium hydrocarbonoxydans]SEC30489.1 hypothetical protein SAMN04489807_3378 [Microbacterium hydrocarbonoxydans]
MTPIPRTGRTLLLASLLTASLLATACAASDAPAPASSVPIPQNDGIDGGGAAEVASPARALIAADEHGRLLLLDLDTEQRSELATDETATEDADAAAVPGSGRFAHLVRVEGDRTVVDVLDSGRWTVPHGDHSHSFLGEPGLLGTVEGTGEADIRVGDTATAIRFGREVVLLYHERLAKIDDAPRLDLAIDPAGPVIPFAGHLLAATGETVDVLAGTGTATGVAAPCSNASDVDLTRVGAVFACDAGAVLVTREVGGALAAEAIPYPADAPAAPDLAGRADRPDLAGVAGSAGAWLLDVRARSWTLLATDTPLIRAAAIGDDESRTVVIGADGTVRVLAADGAELARTAPLLQASVSDPILRDQVQLIVDARHAYVSDPATGAVHEIDHGDGTVARTFDDLDAQYIQPVG